MDNRLLARVCLASLFLGSSLLAGCGSGRADSDSATSVTEAALDSTEPARKVKLCLERGADSVAIESFVSSLSESGPDGDSLAPGVDSMLVDQFEPSVTLEISPEMDIEQVIGSLEEKVGQRLDVKSPSTPS
jgi:hypothetical protein